MLRAHWLKLLLTGAFTLLCLWLLAGLVDLRTVADVIRRSNLWFVALALGCYLASYALRALRIQRIYRQQQLSLASLWPVIALNNLLNYLLPLRTGDLSLVYFLKTRLQVAVSAGAGIWLLTRMLDILMALLCLALAVAVYVFRGGWSGDMRLLASVVALSAALIAATWMLPTLWRAGLALLAALRPRVKALQRPWFERLQGKLAEVAEVLQLSREGPVLLEQTIISLGIWVALFGFFWAVLQSIGITYLGLPEIVIGSSGAVIINFLPLNSFASIGTLQAGWAGGFALVGMPAEDMLVSGVVVHVWVISFATALALLALGADLGAARARRRRAHA